jgi:hypothetical protein
MSGTKDKSVVLGGINTVPFVRFNWVHIQFFISELQD